MAEIILTIVVEVVKCLTPPAYSRISYLRESKYTSNLQNLKAQVEKLKSERASTAHQVDEAKRKGEEIEENVKNWLAGADNVIEEADKFTEDEAAANKRCFEGLCPNLKTRRRLSKEAERQKEAVVKVREDGGFNSVSYSIIPEDTLLMSNKDYEAFESRTSILNEIIDALKNPDVISLGIYGMGGIGKTTLAKEVARKAERDELFDQVVFSEVSESRDVRKIQGEIADKLGLKFDEESESGRARILYDRLKKEKRILVILDNIWEYLDLKAAGIPHGDDHKGCKILLTARNEDVLSREMDSQKNFPVGVLKEDEAWSLFKKMAGDYVEGNELKEVARGVAKECAGLPVAIVTVARALKTARLFEWKDALEQLRRPSSSNFKDVQPAAYKAIELSYNKLERDELKKTFLLIGYTAIESIDQLLMYGMGLGLFQGVEKMEAARARVQTLVQKLKASCMLLDDMISSNEEDFSMHDVVRDVAISIASSEQNVFLATDKQVDVCREYWSDENAVKLCTSIVLRDIKTNVLPDRALLECPQLKLFSVGSDWWESLSITFPDNFFSRTPQIRVIVFANIHLSPLPSSLGLLSNLRTLILYGCEFLDINVIRGLKELEILCLQGCNIEKLPVEVGELTWLKLLDLRGCWKLEVIPPNILSKLSHLEELYIGDNSFCKWEVEVDGVKNASLEELKHLPNLTSLELHIHDVSTLPRGLFLEKLERYSIRIGDWFWERNNIWCREFRRELNNKSCLKDSLMVQLQRIEDLELRGLQEQDINYFLNELVKVGSSHLKSLCLRGSHLACNPAESKRQEESANDLRSHEIILEDNVQISNTFFIEKVALPNLENLELESINVERIWQNQVTVMSCGIQNLTHLTLYRCMNLRCLFSSSTVSSFVRLQSIEIRKCPILEELMVMDSQEERKNNIVMFPQLQYLMMFDLEKFTSFCTGDLDILEFPSLKELWISGCPQFMVMNKSTTSFLTGKVGLPNLEYLKLGSINVERIWQNQVTAMSCRIQNLTHLTLYGCMNLRCLFSSSTVSSFVRLQSIEISQCPILEELMAMDNQEERKSNIVALPQLQYLRMDDLEKLTSFCTGDVDILEFPSLKELNISLCPQFMARYKSTTSFLTGKVGLPNLEYLMLESINIERIWQNQVTVMSCGIQNLTRLTLDGCWNLRCLFSSSTVGSFVRLQSIEIRKCLVLKFILTPSIARTLVRLRYMEIQSCDRITEIVRVDDVAKDEVITFRELELKLLDLKSLTSFCSGNCAFKFPSLERLVVDDCPNMKTFSEGKLSTPKLQKVQGRGEACWAWKDDLNTTIQKASFPRMVVGVWSDDSGLQLEATTSFRNLLSMGRSPPPIEKVIQSGVVPRFVEFLMKEDNPQLQFEAARTLTKITFGTSKYINVVIDHGAVPIFVKLLASPSGDVREETTWALGNVACDSPRCRDLVLGEGALIPLLAQLNEHAKLSMLRIATRTLSNLCKGKPQPPFDQVRSALPALAQLIHLDDEEVLSHACWTLSYLSDGTNDKIQVVIEAGVCRRLVELLGHPSPSVLTPALRTVGNIVTGDDFHTQCIINHGAVPYLLDLLIHNHAAKIKKEACWTISNITAGNREQIQAVIDAGLIGALVNLLQNDEFFTKVEAAFAISNATMAGTHEQIKYLVREGCIKPLCDHLRWPYPWIVTACLKGLENILKVGEAEKYMGAAIGDVNQYAQLVKEAEGFVKIGIIRSHDNHEISEKAVEILETYGCLEEDHDTEEEDAQGSDY